MAASDNVDNKKPVTLSELKKLVERYGPIFNINDSDGHLPTSVDWFVKHSRLYDDKTKTYSDDITAETLPTGEGTENCYLELIEKSNRKGDFSKAKAYVKLHEDGTFVDVQFWILYPYRGSVNAKITNVTAWKVPQELPFLGEKEGEWEYVALRFDSTGDTARPLSVQIRGEWHPFADCDKKGDKVVVSSSSKNGMSLSMTPEQMVFQNRNVIGDIIRVEIPSKVETSTEFHELDCSVKYEIIDDRYANETPIAPWTTYRGRFGKPYHEAPSDVDIEDRIQRYVNPWPERLPRFVHPYTGPKKQFRKLFNFERITFHSVAEKLEEEMDVAEAEVLDAPNMVDGTS